MQVWIYQTAPQLSTSAELCWASRKHMKTDRRFHGINMLQREPVRALKISEIMKSNWLLDSVQLIGFETLKTPPPPPSTAKAVLRFLWPFLGLKCFPATGQFFFVVLVKAGRGFQKPLYKSYWHTRIIFGWTISVKIPGYSKSLCSWFLNYKPSIQKQTKKKCFFFFAVGHSYSGKLWVEESG